MKSTTKASRKTLDERKKAESQITELKSTIRYDTTEYPIGYLTKMFDNGKTEADDDEDYVTEKFVIPSYQREEDIWSDDKKSLFIESILLGLPIPYIFLYEDENGDLEIVDGVQRLSTLYSFVQGNLRLKKMEKLTDLQGFYFYDLTDTSQKRFKNTTLRAVKLDARGVSSEEFRRNIIFARINDGGEKLNDAEFRRGSFPGKFTDFVDELCENASFVALTPYKDNKRKPRFELVLRFLAYIDHYEDVKHDVAKYLDKFLISNQDEFDEDRYKREFQQMCDCLINCLGDSASGVFKNSSGKIANSRYEAISVGTALALRRNASLISSADFEFIKGDEFGSLVRGDGSNNPGRLKGRIEFVMNKLLGE
jgi:uncharacterized protein with ParB-like and HNH nuclease domain